jgi:hypothetical protein
MISTTVFRFLLGSVSARLVAVGCACMFTLVFSGVAHARQATGAAGHWVGTLQGPGLEMEVDISSKSANVWTGTVSIPAQGVKWVPLAELTIKGSAVSFAIKGAPGDPRFSGTLAADAKTISGDFSQGGATMPLTLTRKGDPQFEVREKSTPIAKDIEGTWEGSLDIKGTILRLVLKLANGPNGATGTLISLDQNNLELPISTITQQGPKLKLVLTMISGTFEGEVKGAEIAGTWTQGALTLPLVFKRPAK